MPIKKLTDFLDQNRIQYVTIRHSIAYTAQEIAASAHIKGKNLAKTVIVRADGQPAMAVLPANNQVDLERLKESIQAKKVELASEEELSEKFPNCEVGTMPPFGNLYAMPVYVDRGLTRDQEIAFQAGSHVELVQLSYPDYQRLVKPRVLEFARS